MSLERQCPPSLAKTITGLLLGEKDHEMPSGTPTHSYFATMSMRDALDEFDQIYRLNEGDRMRDLMERLGEDGSKA